MLTRLRGEGWVYAGRLRERADFSENSQVFYRMERYLIPAGLVEEAARTNDDEPRQFRLTDEGSLWLEQNTDEIATPATRDEMRELAREGYEAGTSARESVQNYRKKVSRIKNRLEDVEAEVDEISDKQESNVTTLSIQSERSRDNRERSKETKDAVADLQDQMDTPCSLRRRGAAQSRRERAPRGADQHPTPTGWRHPSAGQRRTHSRPAPTTRPTRWLSRRRRDRRVSDRARRGGARRARITDRSGTRGHRRGPRCRARRRRRNLRIRRESHRNLPDCQRGFGLRTYRLEYIGEVNRLTTPRWTHQIPKELVLSRYLSDGISAHGFVLILPDLRPSNGLRMY
jgi:hypothetical protein